MKKVSLGSVPLVLTFSSLAVCSNNSNNKENSSSNHIKSGKIKHHKTKK